MYGVIYKITNLKNEKTYIGQTIKTVEYRLRQHINDAKRLNSTVLHRAMNKYGTDFFKIEIIDTADTIEELNIKEIQMIKDYKSLCSENGYNELIGGGSAACTEYTKRKRSASLKGLKKSSAAVANMKMYWTDERKKEKSDKMKGKVSCNKEQIEKMRISKIGKIPQWMKTKNRLVSIKCLNNGKIYTSSSEACKELDINSGNLSKVLSGKLPHTKNYRFEKIINTSSGI